MDYSKYRKSGELSDLTVLVDGQEFKVHKFPLFTRSDYFKKALESPSTSEVKLEAFPGGSSTFETIADHLYGKQVDVNASNAVPIKCAVDYLKLNDENVERQPAVNQQPSLESLADAVITNAAQTAKVRRDYRVPLDMLGQAANSAQYAEPSGINKKLIDSFVDSLANNLNSSSTYDPYGYYDPKKSNAVNDSLSKEDIDILNTLPLPWLLDMIKSAQKAGLNQQVLANIIKNYLDYNTDLNPYYNEQLKAEANKPTELIAMAADILKVDKKVKEDGTQGKKDEAEEKKNGDNKNEEKPSSLIKIAGEILGEQPKKEVKLDDGSDKDKDKDKKDNLTGTVAESQKPPARQRPPKKELSNPERLQTVTDVTKALNELKLNPPFPLPWLMLYKNALNDLGADEDTKSTFNRWAREALLNESSKVSDDDDLGELGSIPPSVMVQLVKDLTRKPDEKKNAKDNKDKEADEDNKDASKGDKDKEAKPKVVAVEVEPLNDKDQAKVVKLIDRYINELDKQDKLTPENFIELASSVPKEKRESYDNLMGPLLHLLNKEGDKINPETKNNLLSLIDFNKLSEKTLEECKDNEHIPPKYVAEAALALVVKLRKELDDTKKNVPKPYDYVPKPSPTYNNPTAYNPSNNYNPSTGYSSSPIYNPTPVYASSPNYNNLSSSYNPSSNRLISDPITSSTYNPRIYSSNTQPVPSRSSSARSPIRDSTIYNRQAAPLNPQSSNSQFSSTNGNKVIYPIPIGRSGIETTTIPSSTTNELAKTSTIGSSPYARDRSLPPATTSIITSPNGFEATTEIYNNNECADQDYFYSTSYSYSTISNC